MTGQISAIDSRLPLPLVTYFLKKEEKLFEDTQAYYQQVVRILFTSYIEKHAKDYSHTIVDYCLQYKSFDSLHDFEKNLFEVMREQYSIIDADISRVNNMEVVQNYLRDLRECPNKILNTDERGLPVSNEFKKAMQASKELMKLVRGLTRMNEQELASSLLLLLMLARHVV